MYSLFNWFLVVLFFTNSTLYVYGLLEAVKDLPVVQHRHCERHILANFRKIFPKVYCEKMVWKACKTSTEPLDNAVMKEIILLNPLACEYLMEKNP